MMGVNAEPEVAERILAGFDAILPAGAH